VDHDLIGMNFEQVQAAAPDDQSDEAVAVVGRQLPQALGGPLQDQLVCVFEGPLNGIGDRPD